MSGIRHVVALTLRDDLTDEQRSEILAGLGGLPGQIPEIEHYEFGFDLGRSEGNVTLAIVGDFASWGDYEVYRDHQAHKVVIDLIAPVAVGRAAVQFER